MRERGVRQHELGRRVGLTGALISNVVCGRSPISLEAALRLSLATGLPLEAFVKPSVSRLVKLYGERQMSRRDIAKETSNVA